MTPPARPYRFEGPKPDRPGVYVYRIRSTGAGSAKFGLCEVCQKYVSETFIQTEGVSFEYEGQIMITHHECAILFGHRECLLGKRR
jgi:hypothetical protein